MSEALHSNPLLVVAYQRALADGRVVTCGPAYRLTFLQWKTPHKDVRIYDPKGGQRGQSTQIDFSKPHMLASDELLGFDPISDECPRLRAMQHYGSAVFKPQHGDQDFVGCVVFPASSAVTVKGCRAFMSLHQDWKLGSSIHDDIEKCHGNERLVLRCGERNALVVIEAKALIARNSWQDIILIDGTGLDWQSARTELRGCFPTGAEKSNDSQEQCIGELRFDP